MWNDLLTAECIDHQQGDQSVGRAGRHRQPPCLGPVPVEGTLDGADPCDHSVFFFQAEDGIRDYKVTGVQTCALPITTQAGALFGYELMWAIALGTAAIIIYMEMCGRVAVVANEPVFAVVHTRLGKKLGLAALIASNLLNLITCAAEIGGIAILLHLLTGWPEKVLLVATALALGTVVLLFRFQWIERTFGLSGLMMIIFAVSAVTLHPDWGQLAHGLIPKVSEPDTKHTLLYWYFAVGIF